MDRIERSGGNLPDTVGRAGSGQSDTTRRERFERPASGFAVGCSIQRNYRRPAIKRSAGIDLPLGRSATVNNEIKRRCGLRGTGFLI